MLRFVCGLLGATLCLSQWTLAVLQQDPPKPADRKTDSGEPKDPKAVLDEQMAVSGRYARFERMLIQMADVLARQDPERADLLRRAIAQGREDTVKEDIEKIVELLDKGDLGAASEKQAEVMESFQTLLKLLQSEDRRSSVERERERLNGLLKGVNNIIAEQRSARAATQNSPAPSNAAPGQQRAIDGSEKLLESIREHDSEEAEKEAGQKEDGEKSGEQSGEKSGEDSGDKKSGGDDSGKKGSESDGKEGKSSDGKSKDGSPKNGEKNGQEKSGSEKSEGKSDSKSEQNADGKKSDGQKSGQSSGQKGEQGQKGTSSPPQNTPQTPGRDQIERAQQQMEQALKELQDQQKDNALKDQDKALEELHAAAEELEKKLKQLREEEKEMVLASLEARFQRMLAAETQIHEGTLALAVTPQKDWLDASYGRCRELAQQQTELARECSQTVGLLREDGSAVAMLLAVEDIEADMQSVSGWLQESNVAELTQSVQKDIIESLKQLIETTQREMQEMKNPERQQQQQQQGQQQQSALVELMAEIRVLRNLQLQVNRRTKQVDQILQTSPAADQGPLQKQIRELADRQQRLIETAKELAKQAEKQGPG
ncbi:MAG: hypothetical protein U0996_10900 [Planctomycetaceae bacterium]